MIHFENNFYECNRKGLCKLFFSISQAAAKRKWIVSLRYPQTSGADEEAHSESQNLFYLLY